MLTENQLVYERYRLYHLMRAHPDWSLRAYARELGHDPKWVRTWAARLKPHVSPDLSHFASHSRRPRHSPRRVPTVMEKQICVLRPLLSERFHRRAGGKTIYAILREMTPEPFPIPCPRTIHTVLKRCGVIVPRAKPVHELLVLPRPMDEWEMDFGEIYLGPDEGKLEFFLVVDRGTSRVIYLEGSSGYNAETALDAVVRLFILYGMPKRLRFDRDVRLFGSWTRDSYPSPLVCLLRCFGVEDIICPPHRPDLKPFVERCIQTLKYEWLARYSPRTFAEAVELLPPFMRYHNSERPHQGQACQNRIPDEVFPILPACAVLPDRVQPDAWVRTIHGRQYRRRVNSNGAILIDRHSYYVGEAWAQQEVVAQVDAAQEVFHILCETHTVKTLAMKGLVTAEMEVARYIDLMKGEARTLTIHRMLTWEKIGPPF
jgi:hypothetical protein